MSCISALPRGVTAISPARRSAGFGVRVTSPLLVQRRDLPRHGRIVEQQHLRQPADRRRTALRQASSG